MQSSQSTILEDFLINCDEDYDNDLELQRIVAMEKKTAESCDAQPDTFLHGIRCAAHTAELCVKDITSKSKKRADDNPCIKYMEAIQSASNVVSKLRTPTMIVRLEAENLPMPLPMIEVRWSSVSTMVTIYCEIR